MPHSYNDRSMAQGGRVMSANDRKLLAVMRGHPRYAALAEQLDPAQPSKPRPKPKAKAAAEPEPRNVKPAGDENKIEKKPPPGMEVAQESLAPPKPDNPHAVGAMTTKDTRGPEPAAPEPPAKSDNPHAVGGMTTQNFGVPKPEPKSKPKGEAD